MRTLQSVRRSVLSAVPSLPLPTQTRFLKWLHRFGLDSLLPWRDAHTDSNQQFSMGCILFCGVLASLSTAVPRKHAQSVLAIVTAAFGFLYLLSSKDSSAFQTDLPPAQCFFLPVWTGSFFNPRTGVRVCSHRTPGFRRKRISPVPDPTRQEFQEGQELVGNASGWSRPFPLFFLFLVRPGASRTLVYVSQNQPEVPFRRCYRLEIGDIVARHGQLALAWDRLGWV